MIINIPDSAALMDDVLHLTMCFKAVNHQTVQVWKKHMYFAYNQKHLLVISCKWRFRFLWKFSINPDMSQVENERTD